MKLSDFGKCEYIDKLRQALVEEVKRLNNELDNDEITIEEFRYKSKRNHIITDWIVDFADIKEDELK